MASEYGLTRYICLFHDAQRARAAIHALENLDLPNGAISALGDEANPISKHGTDMLQVLGVPDRDLKHIQDGLRQGGVLVSLQAPESSSGRIEQIFHQQSADKIDETEGTANDDPSASAYSGTPVLPVTETTREAPGGELVLPIAEEELHLGKRNVDRGAVRISQRTVEEPVERAVDLHSERVVLGYSEVNRPATEADFRAGGQEIELIETAEVPVVEKVARVVEEVRVGKVATERVETVHDTLRHTEVEVETFPETDEAVESR